MAVSSSSLSQQRNLSSPQLQLPSHNAWCPMHLPCCPHQDHGWSLRCPSMEALSMSRHPHNHQQHTKGKPLFRNYCRWLPLAFIIYVLLLPLRPTTSTFVHLITFPSFTICHQDGFGIDNCDVPRCGGKFPEHCTAPTHMLKSLEYLSLQVLQALRSAIDSLLDGAQPCGLGDHQHSLAR
jgi:hypothetical protein